MLDVSDLVTAYGKIEALKGVSLRAERGQDHLPARAEWCRQDHADDDDRRHPAAAPRLDPARRRRAGRTVAGADRRAGGRAGAGEPAGLSADERAREPARGRLSAPRQGGDRGRSRAHVRALSAPARAARAAGRHALRRRAADAGGRARADVAAARAADGRAVARARAAGRRRDLPHRRASSIATAPPSSWSSRTPTWRCRWRISSS